MQDAVQIYYKEDVHNNDDEIEIWSKANQWQPLELRDESRGQLANKDGGKLFDDDRQLKCMRSVGKYVLQQIGKKLLCGDMNLTRISFPIKAMIAKSALEKNLLSAINFPLYVNRASKMQQPLEQLKLVITATISSFYTNLSFNKPLNPIIGETVEGTMNDGTQLYAEQISHHPPISQFYCIGPNYKYFGNYWFEASAGLNSITLRNRGKRTVVFDNERIDYNFAYEQYSGTIFGKMRVETLGQSIYKTSSGLEAVIRFGEVKGKPSDYFVGVIRQDGVDICKIYGSYMGFIEFDGVRYWDHRQNHPFKITFKEPTLESDAQLRGDYVNLKNQNFDKAQEQKELLENVQRNDQKLRQRYKEFMMKQKQETTEKEEIEKVKQSLKQM
ncbi:Oxysterol-binding protein 4 [Paramecium bursaria]